MKFSLEQHVIPTESVHPSPDSALLTPRAKAVNWRMVAQGKVAQRIANFQNGKIIPNFVRQAATAAVLNILTEIDLDQLDEAVDRIVRAAVEAYEQSEGAIVAADTQWIVMERTNAATTEIRQEVCALAMQAA